MLQALFILLSFAATIEADVFANISVSNGLSNNSVNSICQDSKGNIWLATKDGVNKYDGYEVTVFGHSYDQDDTIQSNLVNYVYKDSNGTVWACTADGLSRYVKSRRCFSRVELEGTHSIEQMIQIDSCRYLLCTRNASILYDSNDGSSTKIYLEGEPLLYSSVCRADDCFVFCTTSRKIETVYFSPEGGFERVCDAKRLPGTANTILYDNAGTIWIGARFSLLKYNIRDGFITRIPVSEMPDDRIQTMDFDDSGRIWIGTRSGICIYDPISGMSRLFTSNPHEENALTTNSIRVIFKDRDGNMWAGSSYGGVDFFDCKHKVFKKLGMPSSDNYDNIIRSVCVDEDSLLWIGTRYGGLDCYDPKRKQTVHHVDARHILSVVCPDDDRDVILVGTYEDGLLEVNRHTGHSRTIFKGKDINDIVTAGNGKVWIASLSGLYLVDRKSGAMEKQKLTEEKAQIRVTSLMMDNQHKLWIVAKENLMRFNVEDYCSISRENIPVLDNVIRAQCLYQAYDSTVWIGTSDGLLRFRNDSLERAPSETGLKDESITGIVQEDNGNLWISTNNSLCLLNPKTWENRFFYENSHLHCGQINVKAICKSEEGTIYLGGCEGVVYFNPDDIANDRGNIVEPNLTSLVVEADKTIDLTDVSEVTIKHKDHFFSINFTCPDFASLGNNIFKYKLEGYDHVWMNGEGRKAIYTNVRHGNYIFKVKSASPDGIWADKEASVRIRVLPAWYNTLAAKILLGILLLSAAYYLASMKLRKISERNNERIKGIEQKYANDIKDLRVCSYSIQGKHLTSSEESFLSEVLDNIYENISDPGYSVVALASHMCMSRSSLHSKVKSVCNKSPVELIKELRIDKACALIKNGNHNMSEIAEMCGFSSLSYFSTCFHKEIGMPPGDYDK